VLPEIVKGWDLAGSCVGFVSKDNILDGSRVKPGDSIIGLASTGLHSNGYTLARKIIEREKLRLTAGAPGRELGWPVPVPLLETHDSNAARGEPPRQGRAGRTCADHDDIGARRPHFVSRYRRGIRLTRSSCSSSNVSRTAVLLPPRRKA